MGGGNYKPREGQVGRGGGEKRMDSGTRPGFGYSLDLGRFGNNVDAWIWELLGFGISLGAWIWELLPLVLELCGRLDLGTRWATGFGSPPGFGNSMGTWLRELAGWGNSQSS